MRAYIKASITLFFFIILTVTAHAATLWQQDTGGWNGTISCNGYVDRWLADDFQLSNTSLITDIEWIGGKNSGDPSDAEGFWIRIFSNYYDDDDPEDESDFVGYRPSDTPIIAQYYDADVVTRSTSPVSGQYYTYSLSLTSSFLAESSTIYWLSIQGDTINLVERWYGLYNTNTTNLNETVSWVNGTYFDETYHDYAFNLYGQAVPIPPTAWLFLTSLIGVVGICRKIKN